MKKTCLALGSRSVEISLPEEADVYRIADPAALPDPQEAIRRALASPIGARPLALLAREAVARTSCADDPRPARAVIVVSDNTRPVPYRGEAGILLPIVETLLAEGFKVADILVLVAVGTHRQMDPAELRQMIDARIWSLGIEVANHDCHSPEGLADLGQTRRGSRVQVNRRYIEADLRILTGLVESHFMAGASGGRKSICPGLIGLAGTHVFHGAAMMAHPMARDLVLDGNPCHEESLEAARMAGADFIVNVTLDAAFRPTGVFAGELDAAHRKAVEGLRAYVGIPVEGEYDIVVTHAGYVGRNHYQAAKAAVAALGALRVGGHLIMVADHIDPVEAVGSPAYRTTMGLLKLLGPAAFTRMILSPDWTFLPDQWQTQMWAKVFERIPMENLCYFAPQLDDKDWGELPGMDGRPFLGPHGPHGPGKPGQGQAGQDSFARFVEAAIFAAREDCHARGIPRPRLACLADGPYGIPYKEATHVT